MVECRWRANGAKTDNFDGETDSTRTYNNLMRAEHEFKMCESVLVSSPDNRCSVAAQNLGRMPMFLTSNHGIASNMRFANSLGFKRDDQLVACTEVVKQEMNVFAACGEIRGDYTTAERRSPVFCPKPRRLTLLTTTVDAEMTSRWKPREGR